MPKKPGDGKGKHQRISFAPAPDPQSPMGRASGDDGARFRASPYLMSFVRPLVSGEFGDFRVVSPERLKVCTHVFVTRIDPTSVARTRIPLTPEQAEWQQAFGVLDLQEIQKAPKGMKQGPLSLPEETHQCTILAAALGIYTAFQAYPHLERNETALESRARELANQRVHTWPEIVNDTDRRLGHFKVCLSRTRITAGKHFGCFLPAASC